LVAKNEPDKKVREFARESVDLITEFSGTMEKLRKEKEIDQKKFENEYRVLNDSYGTEGDYIKLLKYSSLENENELRKLRVRILERNSDEALYDYKKINDIIGFNWLLNDN
jgi:hypothetical protein